MVVGEKPHMLLPRPPQDRKHTEGASSQAWPCPQTVPKTVQKEAVWEGTRYTELPGEGGPLGAESEAGWALTRGP